MKIIVVGNAAGPASVGRELNSTAHDVIVLDPQLDVGTGFIEREPVLEQLPVELTSQRDVLAVFERAIEHLGGLDTVVLSFPNEMANATASAIETERALSASLDEWDKTAKTVLNGGLFCTRAALRYMTARQRGSIIYICADAAVDGRLKNRILSTASCGLLALGSSLASSGFRHGVAINSVIVGAAFDAADLAPREPVVSSASRLAYATGDANIKLREKRICELNDRSGVNWQSTVAGIIDFLSSEQSRMIAGATLRVANVGAPMPLIRWSY